MSVAAEESGPALTNPALPILVIGAGPAGLAALRAFQKAGIAAEGVERHWGVGGIWDQASPGSPTYDKLETNSSLATQHLGDPWPEGTPPFVSHQMALQYLKDFSVRHGLLDGIRFRTEVRKVERNEDGTWQVETDGPEGHQTKIYRAVVVASGRHHQSKQFVPEELREQAREAGLIAIHASEYRNAEPFRGLRVLVLGMGNSASDITTEISEVAAGPVLLSVRNSAWFVPLKVLWTPADKVGASGNWIPFGGEHALFRFLQWWTVGTPTSLGFPQPDHELMQRLPVSDRGLAQAIRSGNVVPRSNLKSLNTGLATFENPEHPAAAVDAVVFATGYRQAFPFLPDAYGNVADPEFPLPFHIFHPTEPGLSFMTELVVPQSGWSVSVNQADTLAAYYQAEVSHPERAREFNRRRRIPNPDFKGALFQKADSRHVSPRPYDRSLKNLQDWFRLTSEP